MSSLMTNIAESVERDYQALMENLNQRAKIGLGKRVKDALIVGASVAATYGVLISIRKLLNLDPQYANVDFLEYLKLSYARIAPYLTSGVPMGLALPEIGKGITWFAYQPMKFGAKGIDYINKLVAQHR